MIKLDNNNCLVAGHVSNDGLEIKQVNSLSSVSDNTNGEQSIEAIRNMVRFGGQGGAGHRCICWSRP